MNQILNTIFENKWISVSAVVIIGITYWLHTWYRTFGYWKSRNIATPKPIPILGNLLPVFLRPRPHVDLEWNKTYGKIYGTYVKEKPTLNVADPQILKQILVKDFHLFRNRRDNGSRHKIFSKIIFFTRDDDWKRIRSISSPTFTTGKLRKMFALINDCCNDFIKDLEEKVENQKEFELKDIMGAYTMDVIARCAFASQTNTYKDPNNEFTTRANNIFKIEIWKMIALLSIPTFLFKIERFRQLIANTENQDFFVNFTTKIMKYRRDNNQKHNDFLQLLMDAEISDGQTIEVNDTNDSEAHHVNEGIEELNANKKAFSDVIGKKLTENEILAQCFLFFIAGYETTATTLSYCSYELALNPEIQRKLYDEIKEAFDEKEEINYDVLSKLPFLDAVISETLRNYPPIIRLEREAAEDVILGDSGIKLEKGIVAEIPVYAIHHDPENYADPFVFNPDRFMPENRDKIKPYTYLPFGVGPRNCLGMRFALLEAKLALVRLLQKFKFSRVANTDVPIIFNNGRGVLQAKRIIVGIDRR